MREQFMWRRDRVIRLVYPRSFLGASGSGTGGLNGFTQKLNCRRATLVSVAAKERR